MDAKVDIWIGLNLSGRHLTDVDLGNFPENLAEELEDAGELKEDGLTFERLYCSDEVVGFGVKLFSHDWDYGVKEFNPKELIQRKKPLLPG